MNRYLFQYEVLSLKKEGEFSVVAQSEEEAASQILERVADIEFTDEDDVKIGRLIKVIEAKDHYYECEGCT
ncbi:hypothetical protein [Priestia endophytica]|uniref:hypothetical protein n=1 Tax=Priestia endophytica TaxID=135735 RepID=UPI000DCA88B8|nr:hypothetical protein [Priestia endophytica]RAS79971.1 hypothetical protein A4U60_14940 [Priestia endophytica]